MNVGSAAAVIADSLTWARDDLAGPEPWLVRLAVDAAQQTESDQAIEESMRVLMGDVVASTLDPQRRRL